MMNDAPHSRFFDLLVLTHSWEGQPSYYMKSIHDVEVSISAWVSHVMPLNFFAIVWLHVKTKRKNTMYHGPMNASKETLSRGSLHFYHSPMEIFYVSLFNVLDNEWHVK